MQLRVILDKETKSWADLKKVGAWNYSLDPTTDIICLCYCIKRIEDDGTVSRDTIKTWWPGELPPSDLFAAIKAGALVVAHNVDFEYSIWVNVMMVKYGWPAVPDDNWRDTMAAACYYAMPAKLDQLHRALGGHGKDPEGTRLINKYSKLYAKNAQPVIPPEDFDKWVAYCLSDVQEEDKLDDYLGELPDREIPVYLLDKAINRRGIFLDDKGINDAVTIVEQVNKELTAEFRQVTACPEYPAGLSTGQRDKLLAWFLSRGLKLPNLKAETIEDLIKDEDINLPQGPARRALEIRLKINKASTKKLDAMLRHRGPDGRARFQTRYHGAMSGRPTGSGFQVLNLVRSWEDVETERLVADIAFRDSRWLDCVYGSSMEAVAKASRHWIMAEEGNILRSGDFVSIEAVINACLAGEEWKINVFRNKEPVYERTADKIFNFAPGTVTKKTHPKERQDGKTCELAFGYQGALNAWLKFDSSGRHSDERIVEICKAWRAEHPCIVALWRGLEAAAVEAVANPKRLTGYRAIGFETVDEWLSMILPNGKRIWYYDPQLRAVMPPWHREALLQAVGENGPNEHQNGTCKCRPKPAVTYMALKTGKWRRVYTYGGKLTENACQSVSREILRPATLECQKAGYNVVFTVYDEIVSETRANFGSVTEYEEIMRTKYEDWYADWPINVDAWEARRYRK